MWSKAHVWFYPCIFEETCCLTAYEAAASNTLVVSNHLAALQESVGNRGIVTNGNPVTKEWQDKTLSTLFDVIDNQTEQIYTNLNYTWVNQHKNYDVVVKDFETKYII